MTRRGCCDDSLLYKDKGCATILESTLPSTMSSNDAMSVDECSETEDILETLDSKVK